MDTPSKGQSDAHSYWKMEAGIVEHITETNRIHLVLVDMQNRTLQPYLAAVNRILILEMTAQTECTEPATICRLHPRAPPGPSRHSK
jgi:hypothetical protein